MSHAIVDSARSWIGTPYHHQASLRGVGCDCLGLVRGVWRDVFGAEPEPTPAYSASWNGPDASEPLLAALARNFDRIGLADPRAGDVFVFRMVAAGPAKHVGILASAGPKPTFVHAYEGACVVEGNLTRFWRDRIVGAGRFPDIAHTTSPSPSDHKEE